MARSTVLFCVALVTIMGVSGCTGPDSRGLPSTVEGTTTRTYEVFGMDCPGCHGGLEKLVEKIPAIREARANWEQQRLVVWVRPNTELDDEDVYDAIRRANFTPGRRIP